MQAPFSSGVVLGDLQFADRLIEPLQPHQAVAEIVFEQQVVRIAFDSIAAELHVLFDELAFERLPHLGVFGLGDFLPEKAQLAVFPLFADVDVAVGKLERLSQQALRFAVALLIDVELGKFEIGRQLFRLLANLPPKLLLEGRPPLAVGP